MRTPLALVVPVALLTLTACSSSSSGKQQALNATAAPTTPGASTAPVTKAPVTGRASATAAPTTAGTAAPATISPRTSPTTAAVAPVTTKAPGAAKTSKATKAGTYGFTSSGTVTIGATPQDASGTQTLVVSALKGDTQRSTLHSDSAGDTVEDLLVRDKGTYVASLTLTSPAFTKSFHPATAVLLVPDPAAVGATWTWAATSTDGKTHVTQSSKVSRAETLTIGGVKVPTLVISTHIVLTGDVQFTADLTSWWAPSLRLAVKDHTVGKGSYSGVPFKTDLTDVMTSLTPS